jgi:hypothetical protein
MASHMQQSSTMMSHINRPARVMLHAIVNAHRHEIIARTHAKVQKRLPRFGNSVEIEHGTPRFLAQLVQELRPGLSSRAEMTAIATIHAHGLLARGVTLSELVHHYGDIGQAITELASERGIPISMDDFRVLDRCLNDAIAGAVTEHQRWDSQLEGER